MRAWHRSITFFFGFVGVAWASWVVRLPEVKELIDVSTAELGLVLLVGSIGSLSALLSSNRFIERFGTKPIVLIGTSVFILALSAAAFAAAAGMVWLVCVCGFILGFGVGVADVAQNVDGSQIEQKLGRSIMPRLHAAYSLGTLVGAGYGSLAAFLKLQVEWQIFMLVPVGAALALVTHRHLPANVGKLAAGETHQSSSTETSGNRRRSAFSLLFASSLFFLGLGIFAITLVEGASNDWLALSLVKEYHASNANAGVGYAFLVGAMTLTRFFGGNLVDSWGRDKVLRRAALVGVGGIAVLIFAPQWFGDAALYVAWFAAACWGVGVALAFPLFLSAAGEGAESARRVALVATCGYTAFLVGPPLLGLLGQSIGLLNMFGVLAACLVLAAAVAGVLKQHKPAATN